MVRPRLLGVLTLYAATVVAVLAVLASVVLAPMVTVHPFSVLFPSGYVLLGALEADDKRPLYAVPLGVCLLAVVTYVGASAL